MKNNLINLFLATIFVVCIPKVNAQISVSTENFVGKCGSTYNLQIKLNAEDDGITAFTCDILVPEGITVPKINDAPVGILSQRCDDHNLNSSTLPDGSYRYMIISMSLNKFKGTDGTIFSVPISLEGEPGIYEIEIYNIYATTISYNEIQLDNVTAQVTIRNPMRADVNEDGEVNVSDITEVIEVILDK